MQWKGSVVAITGASRGIGRALAVAAAAKGARLGLIARSKEELDDTLAAAGSHGVVAEADVGERAQIDEALGSIARALGPIDILVNNAGIGSYGRVSDNDVELFERVMRVNYLGSLYAIKAVLPTMLERGHGHIVNVSSIAGRIGAPFEGAYSASKFALDGLSETLGFELAGKGIGVSVIYPGPVATDFFEARGTPFQRKRPKPVSAEVVAGTIIAAVENGRSETLIPRWLRFPVLIKAMIPRAFRKGTLRDFRRELR